MTGVLARREATVLIQGGRALARRLPVHAASWALLVFACGTSLSAALQRLLLTPDLSAQRLVELDIGEIFAVAAVVSLLVAARNRRPPVKGADLGVLACCALSWFLPEPHAVYAGMTLAALWFIVMRCHDRVLLDIGQVWLTLSVCELWSKLAFKLFYQAIEPFEVALMAWVGRFVFPSLRANGSYLSSSPDWSVVMLEGCSAFHNLSLAGLIWLSVLKIAGRKASPAMVGALAISAGLVLAINIIRILAMIPSPEAYHFWHDEAGSVAVALAAVAASLVPIMIQVERAR